MMQPVALIGQQSVATPLPASQFDPSSSFNVQPSPSFNVQPTPSLNFNPAPAFSFSSPGINPMMQPVSVLDQQVFNAPQPSINFDPFSSFNVEPSPAFSFPDPVVNPMMQPVPVLGQQSFNVPQPAPQFNFNPVTEAGPSMPYNPMQMGYTPSPVSDPSGGFFDPGGFGYENLGPRLVNTLGDLGERFGQFAGEQLYGTDITAEGQATGFPIDRPSVVGDIATLPGNTLRALDFFTGPVVDAIPDVTDYVTGQSGVEFKQQEIKNAEDIKNAALDSQSAQELSRLMEGVEDNSPQANFLAEKAKGDLTSKQIADANAFAKSIGTTFDPELGYSRAPFLESQAVQPQVTQEQLQQLASPKRIAPMGRDATKARIAQLSGLSSPATLNQAITNNPNAVMATDAQGRIRSFASPQAVQQNLTNAQTSFDQASRDRLTRLEQRDVRPGETITERDTRIADSRTEGSDRGGEMSFAEARKFIPKGANETTKAYNERVKAFQAQQNSTINKLKEEYEQYRANGQKLNNDRTNAYIANYQQTEPEKYRETFKVAQEMLNDGILKDKTQMAMYVIDEMGGKSSDIFDPVTEFTRGGDGGAQTYTPEQEVRIERFMKANGLGREDALRELRNAKKIQ